MRDDSGSFAVFIEQGSSASQMTAAKIMDFISGLPGCAGQAADAVSAYTQVKMKDAHKLLKIPSQNVQTFGFVYHDTNGQNHGPVWKTQFVPLERNLYGHPLAGLLWERQFEKILLKHGWEKIPNRECLFVHREKGLFLSVARSVGVPADNSKSYGCHSKTSRMRKDKLQTQYQRTPKIKWKMRRLYSKKFRGGNVQIFGSVCHDTNGQNHGPT